MVKPRTLFITMSIALLIATVLFVFMWDRLPGSFSRTELGQARGTGAQLYYYANGTVQLKEEYSRGTLVRSEWFNPDGTTILVTEWDDGSGEGLYLRQDGSIRRRVTYVDGVAHGTSTYYAEDGSVLGEAEFHEGVRVSGYDPKAAREVE
jgi:antitoxin component YwqK of YwqJK toxin-antitoxin module